MSPLHRSAIPCLLAAACSAAFAGPLDNAWLKGTTDKDPLSYAPGEEIVFTVEPMGVEGDVPEGEYTLEWTRSDDFGARETGRIPFAPTSFVYRTSLDRPGFVRLEAYILGPDGKRYAKKFTGEGSGLTKLNASSLYSGTVDPARLPDASTTARGAMSANDKKKLDAFGSADTYALKSEITSVYRHKGSVQAESDLPKSNNTVGDVYNVIDTGMNYVFLGNNKWDALGSIFSVDPIPNRDIDVILNS